MPGLTEEQIRSITQRSLAAGFTPDQIEQEIGSYMDYGSPEIDPIARLTSQFEGTQAIPTESVAQVEDPGGWYGINKLGPATLTEVVGGPLAGIGETFGLLPVGTRQEIRDEFERVRLEYLAGDPTAGRATVAGLLEAGTSLIPLAPGGVLGGKVAGKLGGGVAGRLAGGAAAGAAEGAVVAVGDTVGLPTEERLKQGALMIAAGAGLGTLGGFGKVGPARSNPDPEVRSFRDRQRSFADKYFSKGDVGEGGEGLIEKARRQWFDEFRSVTRRTGHVLDDAAQGEVEQVLQMARTADHTAVAPIYEHTRAFDADSTITGEPLKDVLFDLDDEMLEDLMVYGASRRNVDLRRRSDQAKLEVDLYKEMVVDAKKSGDDALLSQARSALKEAEENAGIKVSESSFKDSVDRIEDISDRYGIDPESGQIPVLDERLTRFRDWTKRAIVDPLREAGVFSDAEVDAMSAKGEWYVPFIRATEELTELEKAGWIEPGQGLGSAPVKGRRVRRGLDERKGLKIRNIFQEAAERSIRVHRFARQQKVRNMMGDLADEFKSDLSPEIRLAEDKIKGQTFRVWRDGELQHYYADKDLIETIETLDYREAGPIARAAVKMTQIFRAGATLTPEFALRNLSRDQFTYGIYNKEGGMPFLGPARSLIEELWQARFGEGIPFQHMQEFMASPAAHATFLSGDRFNLDREVSIARKGSKGGARGVVGKWIQEAKQNWLAPFQIFSSILERPSRFSEFKRARKRGATVAEASLAASDVTLNFPRAGSIGKRLNLYEAFFNAMMQDIDKFSRSMSSPKSAFKTSMKGFAYLTAPSMAMWAAHKDNEAYQATPEWEKAIYLHLFQRDNGKWFKAPLPPGLLGVMFSYLPRKLADFMVSKDPENLKDLGKEFVEQSPLQYIPLPGGMNSLEDAATRAAPNVAQPIIELINNRIPFFDRPVVSARYERLPASEQKNEYTSSLAKAIAAGGNAIGIESSPLAIDHLISGYGAGLARDAASLTGREAGLRSMEEDGIFALPGLRGFLGSSPFGFRSQPVQDFYEFANAAEESHRGVRLQSTQKHVDNWYRLHPEALYAKDVGRIRRQLREMGEIRDGLKRDTTLSSEERTDKVLAMDQEITRYAAEAMRWIHDAVRMDQALMERKEGQ